MTAIGQTFVLKSTVSIKQRAETGDEVFVSTGMEAHGLIEGGIDAARDHLNTTLDAWLADRISSVGAMAFAAGDADEEGEEAEDEEAEEAEEDEEAGIGEDEINAMSLTELKALVKEQGLEVDFKGLKVAAAREAVIAALAVDDEEAEEGEEDEEAEEGEDEEFEPYTKEELGGMKLAELDEIATGWELTVKHKAGADLKAKKATVIAAILKHQEANAEE